MTVIDLKLFLKDQNHAYQFKNIALNVEVRMDLHSICMNNLKDKQYDVIHSKIYRIIPIFLILSISENSIIRFIDSENN